MDSLPGHQNQQAGIIVSLRQRERPGPVVQQIGLDRAVGLGHKRTDRGRYNRAARLRNEPAQTAPTSSSLFENGKARTSASSSRSSRNQGRSSPKRTGVERWPSSEGRLHSEFSHLPEVKKKATLLQHLHNTTRTWSSEPPQATASRVGVVHRNQSRCQSSRRETELGTHSNVHRAQS